MPTRAPVTSRRNRQTTTAELSAFTPERTAKHVASILGRLPPTVRNMAKRYGLPLAVERKRGATK